MVESAATFRKQARGAFDSVAPAKTAFRGGGGADMQSAWFPGTGREEEFRSVCLVIQFPYCSGADGEGCSAHGCSQL